MALKAFLSGQHVPSSLHIGFIKSLVKYYSRSWLARGL